MITAMNKHISYMSIGFLVADLGFLVISRFENQANRNIEI